MSEACRNRLVRDKKVRILEDGHLRQIRASAALQQGSQLLIPKTAVAQWQEPRPPRTKGDSPHHHALSAITSEKTRTCSLLVSWTCCLPGMPWKQSSCHADARTEMLEDAVVQHLRGNVLHKDRDMLVVNKPAGLPVQGGDGIRVSVDSVLPQLGAGAAERPRSFLIAYCPFPRHLCPLSLQTVPCSYMADEDRHTCAFGCIGRC